jgi:hypothetical protein
MFLIFMFVVKDNGRACAFRDTTARLRSKRRRHKTFGHARDSELIEKCRSALAAERNDKASFDPIYYLDALPTVAEMKSSVAGPAPQRRVLRLFRWGLAQSPNAARRPLQGKEEDFRQAACRRVGRADFVEARDAFVSDPELRECFGGLFRGLKTDPEKMSRLNDWYLVGRSIMAACPGLSDKANLTAIPSERIVELAAKANSVGSDVERLAGTEGAVRGILGADPPGFHESKSKGWNACLECLRRAVERLICSAARPPISRFRLWTAPILKSSLRSIYRC